MRLHEKSDQTHAASGQETDVSATGSHLAYALRYAELGWSIFPLVPGGKDPIVEGGFHRSTTDQEQIKQWWTKHPNAGIGLVPHKSGLCVIDVDTKDGQDGPTQLQVLQDIHGELPSTLQQQSPSSTSGGRHLLFRCEEPLTNTKLAPAIDIRSANGYVVVEPTRLKEGTGYGFIDWDVLTEALPTLAPLPAWVIEVQAQNVKRIQTNEVSDLPPISSIRLDREGLLTRLESFLTKAPKARQRWEGGITGLNDTSGSAKDFSMTAMLKIAGFDYSECVTLMLPWPHGSQNEAREKDRYWQRVWGRTSDPAPEIAWPDPVDPFVRHPTPGFPLRCVPSVVASLALELSRASGFDAGAYAFAMMVAASGLIDHRKRLRMGPMSVPPNLWGGLVAQSGGGKSPVLSAATGHIENASQKKIKQSIQRYKKWAAAKAKSKDQDFNQPPPPIRQLVLDDSTTEGCRKTMPDNPEGLLMIQPEISEWIGRMDAYSNSGSKDRGVWIRAFDTGPVTINRAGSILPTYIENCSISLICGIQPEILGLKFARSDGAGADGLYQRILCYQMAEQQAVNYFEQSSPFGKVNLGLMFDKLLSWRDESKYQHLMLEEDCLEMAQTYHQAVNKVATRTPAKRLAEHLGKYPGLLARVAFVLQTMFDAANGRVSPSVTVNRDVFEKALEVMQVLLRHAEAVYQDIDLNSMGDTNALVKSAAEAILSKGWTGFKSGDLTRDATNWRSAKHEQKEAAIDLLIDLGWIRDITRVEPGKRGRRSDGVYLTNQKVHQQFFGHAKRIATERAERARAIKLAASARNS